MLVLKYIKDPNFKAVFIRQTSTQLSQAGGLFQEAQAMWREFGAKFKSHPQMTATFPSGAEVQFKVCQTDKDINNFDGLQASLVVFDEAQWHSEVQIKYLESRIRSKAKGPHQLIATANPSRTSYLYTFVQAYLDMETGIPRPEMSGKERWYAVYNGATVTGDTKEELLEKYGNNIRPQTYTYISATVKDNPIMRVLNPAYVDRLENLKRTERERLYLGSWHAREEASSLFRRDWVEIIDECPKQVVNRYRGMDIASTLKSEACPNPDWTASVRISKTATHYVVEHVERYRSLFNGVLEHIVDTSNRDYDELGQVVPVVVPRDPGSSGATASAFVMKYLIEHGVDAKTEPPNPHNGKLARMQPFLALCEAGLVKVVRADWNEMWFEELEAFLPGNRAQKDDMWDATASCARQCMKQQILPTFTIPTFTQPSPIPTI